MTRKFMGKFEGALRGHDWFYEYSDDHRVYHLGRQNLEKLKASAQALKCPWDLSVMRCFVHDMIVENFEEREPGCYYRKGANNRYVAPASLNGLIPQSLADEIRAWLEENDND